jgi:HlyD family secretion protein
VKPQISGIITELMKQAGQTVQAGEILAKVKVIPDMGQLSSAQARVRLAGVNVKQANIDYLREKALFDICRKYFHHNFKVSDINRHTKV